MNKKRLIWGLIVLMVIAGLGTVVMDITNWSSSTSKESDEKISKDKKFEENQEELVGELIVMSDEGYRPAELEVFIDEHAGDLNDESLTKMVRELIKGMETSSDYFAQLLYPMENELVYTFVLDEEKNLYEDSDELTNEFVKGYINEMKRNHVRFNPSESSFYIEPDAEYVMDKYGERLTGVFKEYMNLSASQQSDPIFDEENAMYKPERLRDLIVEIDTSRNRWEETNYETDFRDLERHFYQLLFAFNQGTFFDEHIENEGEENEDYTYTMKSDIVETYESFILDNKDLTLSRELKDYLDVLEENELEMNEEVVNYLDDFFVRKFPEVAEMAELQDLDEEISIEEDGIQE